MQTRPRFAPIIPSALYPWAVEKGLIDNYVLVLVQDVLKDPSAYEHLCTSSVTGEERVVILDNGAAENGVGAKFEDMEQAIEIVKPTHVALPDVLGSFEETVSAVLKQREQYLLLTSKGIRLMGIPQGQTYSEIYQCADRLLSSITINLWGIPRHIANKFGTRSHVILHMKTVFPRIPIHMLGFSNYLVDDISCARSLEVMGIDSSQPFAVGMASKHMSLDYPPDREPVNWELWGDTAKVTKMMEDHYRASVAASNIARVHRWLK